MTSTLADTLRVPTPMPNAPGWTTWIEVEALSEDLSCYHADVFRRGRLACRVSLAGAFATQDAAVEALSNRLRQWVADFEERHSVSHGA